MGKIIALCVSKNKGEQKHPIDSVSLKKDFGIVGDAHAGNWHRQISFLAKESIDEFNKKGADVTPGAFGENIIVEGIDLKNIKVGDLLRSGDITFEITQLGKQCHDHCAIYYKMGDCIMPRLGVFARVLNDGELHLGDTIEQIERTDELPFSAAVITLSDKGFKGERVDTSGPAIANILYEKGYNVIEKILLPDGVELLSQELIRLADQRQVDLIITTGGTGFSPRDLTPEATLSVMDRNAPGIAEAIRSESAKYSKHAMLSRGVSVIRKKTLIINLPGSTKACLESMDVFIEALPHAIRLMRGSSRDCARIDKK